MKKPSKPAKPPTRLLNAGGHELGESIPIALLCDMAWRIVKKEDGHKIERGAWIKSLDWADYLIRDAYRIRERNELDAEVEEQEWAEMWTTRKTVLEPLLTAEEKRVGYVEFARGCQLVTGLRKKADAILKVSLAWNDFLQYPEEKFYQAQDGGWRLERLAEARLRFQGIPKEKLRKPYEKSGEHTKEQREKKKLANAKKVLAANDGKKSPKRGGISRA